MQVIRKITDCESLENSHENISDRVFLTKLQIYSVRTKNRLRCKFFLEYVLETCCLKKNILEKSLWCISVLITLFKWNLSGEALKKSHASSRKSLSGNLPFSKVAGFEFIPAILLKTDSTTEVFSHGFCYIFPSKIS